MRYDHKYFTIFYFFFFAIGIDFSSVLKFEYQEIISNQLQIKRESAKVRKCENAYYLQLRVFPHLRREKCRENRLSVQSSQSKSLELNLYLKHPLTESVYSEVKRLRLVWIKLIDILTLHFKSSRYTSLSAVINNNI